MSAIIPGDPKGFQWPTLNIKADKLIAENQSLIDAEFTYGLGAKIEPITQQSPNIYGIDENENKVKAVDCSGDFRWLIYHATAATGEALEVPDGSEAQLEWMVSQGFKPSSFDSACLMDGYIRAGVLLASDTSEGIGHIAISFMNKLIESHGGGVGPSNNRVTSTQGFARSMHWHVLGLPE